MESRRQWFFWWAIQYCGDKLGMSHGNHHLVFRNALFQLCYERTIPAMLSQWHCEIFSRCLFLTVRGRWK